MKSQRLEEIAAWANENGRSPLLSKLYGKDTNGILNLPSALSLATSPFRGAEYVLDALETAYTGAPLPGSTPDFTETTQALRDGVSRDMTETGRFFYDTAMSAADSLVANTLSRGSAGGAILLGLGGASDAAHDIIHRGGTEEQALIGGAVSGILEGVFEKFSLSQLESMKALPVSTTKDALTNIAKSVVTNAGEEGLTELAGTIFDTIFMDELFTYSLTVRGYLFQGKSQADAEKLARQKLFARICEGAASGSLTGILFGGGASASSYYRSRLAAQGEARMRSGQLPTAAELEAMNLSEPEALGEMVLLALDQFDNSSERSVIETQNYADIFLGNKPITWSINGARITDIESSAAEAHAARYYGLARSMKTDVARIAKNTGYSENEIQRIKNYIFLDEHDLGDSVPRRFDPSFAMAQSWQRLIAGTPEPHDITMLKHEVFESELIAAGMSQYDAHIEASKKYNYARESDDYYASFNRN